MGGERRQSRPANSKIRYSISISRIRRYTTRNCSSPLPPKEWSKSSHAKTHLERKQLLGATNHCRRARASSPDRKPRRPRLDHTSSPRAATQTNRPKPTKPPEATHVETTRRHHRKEVPMKSIAPSPAPMHGLNKEGSTNLVKTPTVRSRLRTATDLPYCSSPLRRPEKTRQGSCRTFPQCLDRAYTLSLADHNQRVSAG